ncbi:uncharacterized protein [Ptychodera flava]|uniref:uncharacterized protein n=1 Tax=Ptychodera flava TaxID=63121 RepID=UPI00396A6551
MYINISLVAVFATVGNVLSTELLTMRPKDAKFVARRNETLTLSFSQRKTTNAVNVTYDAWVSRTSPDMTLLHRRIGDESRCFGNCCIDFRETKRKYYLKISISRVSEEHYGLYAAKMKVIDQEKIFVQEGEASFQIIKRGSKNGNLCECQRR